MESAVSKHETWLYSLTSYNNLKVQWSPIEPMETLLHEQGVSMHKQYAIES
jgi:hypothetical protein